MREKRLEHAFDDFRRIFRLGVVVDFPADASVRTKPAADMDVVAFDRVAVLGYLNLGAKETDAADIMLGARIGAAGEVNVHGTVELQARLAPLRDLLGVTLGVGERKPAADIAGASDEAGADRRGLG